MAVFISAVFLIYRGYSGYQPNFLSSHLEFLQIANWRSTSSKCESVVFINYTYLLTYILIVEQVFRGRMPFLLPNQQHQSADTHNNSSNNKLLLWPLSDNTGELLLTFSSQPW